MRHKQVPRFEPEIIASETKRFHGNSEKVATTSFKSMTRYGVNLVSRYQKADEYEFMSKIVEEIQAGQRRLVKSIYCDSKSNSYFVDLNIDDIAQANFIADKIEVSATKLAHSGIVIENDQGFRREIEYDLDSAK